MKIIQHLLNDDFIKSKYITICGELIYNEVIYCKYIVEWYAINNEKEFIVRHTIRNDKNKIYLTFNRKDSNIERLWRNEIQFFTTLDEREKYTIQELLDKGFIDKAIY